MTTILTCKLGNEIINCYDGTHSKEQLKKWASKKILICPACGRPYEYCHGNIKTPYFRHLEKDQCSDRYTEPETQEHLLGKVALYEWIKTQSGVTNVILEGWLPETKQRPDIMFQYNDKTYVIEYQCTPIATQYDERHDLYKAAGIKDIWICGTAKYFGTNMREKYLCVKSNGFYSEGFFYENNRINYLNHCYLSRKISIYRNMTKINNPVRTYDNFYGIKLSKFSFNGTIYCSLLGEDKFLFEKIRHRKIYDSYYETKEKNTYAKMQFQKSSAKVKEMIENSNTKSNGWRFRVYVNYSGCYMYITPVMRIEGLYNDTNYKVTKNLDKFIDRCNYHLYFNLKSLDRLNLMSKNEDELQKALLSKMNLIKNSVLGYVDPYIRVLEVE